MRAARAHSPAVAARVVGGVTDGRRRGFWIPSADVSPPMNIKEAPIAAARRKASREEFSKVIPGVIKMGEIFSGRRKLAVGDWFAIDYVPNVGSTIVVNGKAAADPIKEPEFFNALMKIWLGKSPADAQLKEALLGKATVKDPFSN